MAMSPTEENLQQTVGGAYLKLLVINKFIYLLMLINYYMNEWMSEWISEWVSEWVTEVLQRGGA